MAGVTFHPIIQSAHGKLRKSDNEYFRRNLRTGKTFVIGRDETTYHQNDSPKQRACQQDFRTTMKAVDRWIAANKVSPTPAYEQAMVDFLSQNEIPFLRSFVHRNAERYGAV